jgi:hypothetical protein
MQLHRHCGSTTYLHWFPSQDEECLSSLSQESCELVYKDMLNLIRLLDLDADTNTVDAGLNQDPLIFVSGDRQRVQEDLWGSLCFNFWNIVSFGGLGCEVRETQGCRQGGSDTLKVRPQRLRLGRVSIEHPLQAFRKHCSCREHAILGDLRERADMYCARWKGELLSFVVGFTSRPGKPDVRGVGD